MFERIVHGIWVVGLVVIAHTWALSNDAFETDVLPAFLLCVILCGSLIYTMPGWRPALKLAAWLASAALVWVLPGPVAAGSSGQSALPWLSTAPWVLAALGLGYWSCRSAAQLAADESAAERGR